MVKTTLFLTAHRRVPSRTNTNVPCFCRPIHFGRFLSSEVVEQFVSQFLEDCEWSRGVSAVVLTLGGDDIVEVNVQIREQINNEKVKVK